MTREKTGIDRRAGKPRRHNTERREEILRVAMETFATRGYNNASLAEVADRVGLTQPGLLHHFPSKAGLLTGVLDFRDATEIGELGPERPRGLAFLRHLVETARHNSTREGIVRLYAVLSAESVIDGHPAQDYFRNRYQGLRAMLVDALREAHERGEVADGLDDETVATAIIATMDGLQVQWLLAPEAVDMATATETTIRALIGTDLPPAAGGPPTR